MDAPDQAAVEVGVEEVAAGAELEVDRARGAGAERPDVDGFGQRAAVPRSITQMQLARVVGEEQRAVELGRVACCPAGVKASPEIDELPGRAGVLGDDLGAVVVGVERRRARRRWRRGSRRGSGRRRRSRAWRPAALVAGPAEVLDGAAGRLGDAVDLLPVVLQPTSPIQGSLVPGRIVKRKGLRRP